MARTPSEKTCCPACRDPRSTVITVRSKALDARTIETYRRRRCLRCAYTYATEAIERIIGPHIQATSSLVHG